MNHTFRRGLHRVEPRQDKANAHMYSSSSSDTCSEECFNDMCHYVQPEKLISNKCLSSRIVCYGFKINWFAHAVRSSSPFPNQVKRMRFAGVRWRSLAFGWRSLAFRRLLNEQWRAIVDVCPLRPVLIAAVQIAHSVYMFRSLVSSALSDRLYNAHFILLEHSAAALWYAKLQLWLLRAASVIRRGGQLKWFFFFSERRIESRHEESAVLEKGRRA